MATRQKTSPKEQDSLSGSLRDAQEETAYTDSMLCGMLVLSGLFLSALLAILLTGQADGLHGISFAFPLAYYGIICLLTMERPALLLPWSGYVILAIASGIVPELAWLRVSVMAVATGLSVATLVSLLRGAFPLERWGRLPAVYLQALLLVYHWQLCVPLLL